MAPMQWSDLPSGILDIIAKHADSEIDLLRLRSVCSPWRSSLSPPPQRKPFTFPLKLPPILYELFCLNRRKGCCNTKGGFYKLYEDTLYRLSSPQDPSNGWMFKALKLSNPNTFFFLIPSTTEKLSYPPQTIPYGLNLLNYQISEISKSYRLQAVSCDGLPTEALAIQPYKKIIVLFNYVVDCDFLALCLQYGGEMVYWKIGDESWTTIDTEGHKIQDMIVFDDRCHAINADRGLLLLNSKLQLQVVASSTGSDHGEHVLVKCDKDLYVASKNFCKGPCPEFRYFDELKLSKFNKGNGNWDCVEDLGDKVFLLSEHDESVGVSAKDFQGCKGNCVYLSEFIVHDPDERKVVSNEGKVYGDKAIIYHLDTRKAVEMKVNKDSRKLYWPPPSWLMDSMFLYYNMKAFGVSTCLTICCK